MPLGANKAAIMGVSGVETIGTTIALLSTQTASNSATISFTSDITSKYREYIFKFYNINPATNNSEFQFQGNASSQSGYNETITSTVFAAKHRENDSSTSLDYQTGDDLAQGTGYQFLCGNLLSDADSNLAGKLHLFNPSSTTYVTHFIARTAYMATGPDAQDYFVAGYFNVTAAITNIQFKMDSGNFDGKIKMWGVP